MKKERASNWELLRIISIIMIVFHHYSLHSDFEFQSITANRIITQALSMGGKIVVSLFVMISGFFLVNSQFK